MRLRRREWLSFLLGIICGGSSVWIGLSRMQTDFPPGASLQEASASIKSISGSWVLDKERTIASWRRLHRASRISWFEGKEGLLDQVLAKLEADFLPCLKAIAEVSLVIDSNGRAKIEGVDHELCAASCSVESDVLEFYPKECALNFQVGWILRKYEVVSLHDYGYIFYERDSLRSDYVYDVGYVFSVYWKRSGG